MVHAKRHSKDLRKYRYSQSGYVYLVTTTCLARKPIFKNTMLGTVVMNEIRHSDEMTRTRTFAYVVMPDHLHWLFQLQQGCSLSSIVQRVKGRSAYRINKLRNHTGPIWQPGYHDRTLRADESLEAVGNYVVANPVRGGIVSDIEDYPLWDLMWRRRPVEIRG
jgi:REP element-mobilizing transposase RayT